MRNSSPQSVVEPDAVANTNAVTGTILDELFADQDFCDIIRHVVRKEWADAYNNLDGDCAQGYLPVRGYQESTKNLTKALRSAGWERDQPLGAERWTQWTRYSRPVQLAMAYVHPSGNSFKGASKGKAAEIFDRQGRLFEDDTPANIEENVGGVYPIWILIFFTNDIHPKFQIVLAQATFEGTGNAKYDIHDKRDLYCGPIVPTIDPVDEPESVPIRFDVEVIA